MQARKDFPLCRLFGPSSSSSSSSFAVWYGVMFLSCRRTSVCHRSRSVPVRVCLECVSARKLFFFCCAELCHTSQFLRRDLGKLRPEGSAGTDLLNGSGAKIRDSCGWEQVFGVRFFRKENKCENFPPGGCQPGGDDEDPPPAVTEC